MQPSTDHTETQAPPLGQGEKKPSEKTPECQDFTDAPDSYHKSRRNYGLFSGILAAWELIGISLSTNPLQGVNLEIKSPGAAPLVLIFLVFYFAFRFTIEWHLCHPNRKKKWAFKVDLYVGHALGVASVFIFSFQKYLGSQLVEIIKVPDIVSMLLGLYFGFGAITLLTIFRTISIEKIRIGLKTRYEHLAIYTFLGLGVVSPIVSLLVFEDISERMYVWWGIPVLICAASIFLNKFARNAIIFQRIEG